MTEIDTYYKISVDVMFTQMSVKDGINILREKIVSAIIKSFNQLDKGAIPGKPEIKTIDLTLIAEENIISVPVKVVNLVNAKRYGHIKWGI